MNFASVSNREDETDLAEAKRRSVCEWLRIGCGEVNAHDLDEIVIDSKRYEMFLRRFRVAPILRESLEQPVTITLYPNQEPRLYPHYSAVQYARLARTVPLQRLRQMHDAADALPEGSSMRSGYFDVNVRDERRREQARLLGLLHLQRYDPELDGKRGEGERWRVNFARDDETATTIGANSDADSMDLCAGSDPRRKRGRRWGCDSTVRKQLRSTAPCFG